MEPQTNKNRRGTKEERGEGGGGGGVGGEEGCKASKKKRMGQRGRRTKSKKGFDGEVEYYTKQKGESNKQTLWTYLHCSTTGVGPVSRASSFVTMCSSCSRSVRSSGNSPPHAL